jgi:DNA repair exonuclease SbcCD ATPase subunit
MIIFKELRWSNAFSYGQNNCIRFDQDQITQLVGKNGHGKSSIALILEEVLYNKNSKNIKKSDILNRYVKDKNYSIELDFSKDNTDYTIKTVRGNTQTVKLYKNGEDVSSHTATQTYKTIEETLALDHKTFAQIVYQSHASSLEFLTATDTVRKKFLMEFFDLDIYNRASELFKELASGLSKDVAVAEAKVATVNSWLEKYAKTDLTQKTGVSEPQLDEQLVQTAAVLETQLVTLETTNKKIAQNNLYKKLQSEIELVPLPEKPNDTEVDDVRSRVAVFNKEVLDAQVFIKKMKALKGNCPTCLSDINETKVSELITEKQLIIKNCSEKVTELDGLLESLNKQKTAWEKSEKAQSDWEKYHRLVDKTIADMPLDKANIQQTLDDLNTKINVTKKAIKQAQEQNKQVEAHNAKVETIAKQLVEFNDELDQHNELLKQLTDRLQVLNVLTKTFSTNGLVAYKIESLVKDLEELTNQYLVDLSDGRFQITFQISNRDKLNVVITDNGKDIDIMALSGGERARVNAATLLAIRKLMQSISSSRINLLILDETVEALDIDGKEKLIETLLKEDSLNTFLVSHGFTHPLLEKVYVVKNQNISKIEV